MHQSHLPVIAEHELSFSQVRSSGPGGQNVNKTNSKVILTWNLMTSSSINEQVRARFLELFSSKVLEDGTVMIVSDESRDRLTNHRRCIEKLYSMIEEALKIPKKRKPTKPTKGSKERKRVTKTLRTTTKKARSKVRDWS